MREIVNKITEERNQLVIMKETVATKKLILRKRTIKLALLENKASRERKRCSNKEGRVRFNV